MTATTKLPMSPRPGDFFRRAGGWLGGAVLLALVPKCLLCIAGYAGLAAALGLAGPELCGRPAGATETGWPWLLAFGGVVIIAVPTRLFCRRRFSVRG